MRNIVGSMNFKINRNSMEYLKLKKEIMDQKKKHPFFYHPFGTTIQNNMVVTKPIVGKKIENIQYDQYDFPLITFIVAFYNCELYIKKCLDSILNQTIKNIEIIVVNDGSTDGVESILKEYENFKNVKIITQENKGVSAARNVGIEHATGLYLSFIDGDDYITSDMSEYLLNRCLKYDLDACYFDYMLLDCQSGNKITSPYNFKNFYNQYTFERVLNSRGVNLSILNNSMATGIYKRKIFIDNNIRFNVNVKNGEDCLIKFDNFYLFEKIMYVNKSFYIYCRNRNNSATSTIGNHIDRLIVFLTEMMKLYFKHLDNKTLTISLFNLVLREITYYIHTYNCPKMRDWCVKYLRLIEPNLLTKNVFPTYLNRIKEYIEVKSFSNIFDKITYYRSKVQKTCYIITGQLNSTENEPIDSWSFFDYLMKNNVDTVYVCWKKHRLYNHYKTLYPYNVIGLEGNGVDNLELFSDRMFQYIVRAKYLIQENSALNEDIKKYIYNSKDFHRVFLGHGVTVSDDIGYIRYINIYNVTSKNDRKTIEEAIEHQKLFKHPKLSDKNFVIGGLPRLDHLENKYNEKYKYALIMFTWRSTLNDIYKIKNSDYLKGIVKLLSNDNIKRLRENNIIPVLSIHHHILNNYHFNINLNGVKLAESMEISNYIKKSFVCVTDYSSVNFDFRFLNKPVVFWTPDLNSITLNSKDLEKQKICINRLDKFSDRVNTATDVIDKIIYYSNNPNLDDEKIKLNNSVFKYKTNISKHLYDELEKSYGI